MEKLTKERALELTAEQWEWLAEETGRHKKDYPYRVGEHPYLGCYCCEYQVQQKGDGFDNLGECPDCPLASRWTGTPGRCACEQPGSPYNKWHYGARGKTYAAQIAKMAREELERMRAEVTHKGFCPKCGSHLVTRDGPYGKFVGCSGFPKCDYTNNTVCKECGRDMTGKFRVGDKVRATKSFVQMRKGGVYVVKEVLPDMNGFEQVVLMDPGTKEVIATGTRSVAGCFLERVIPEEEPRIKVIPLVGLQGEILVSEQLSEEQIEYFLKDVRGMSGNRLVEIPMLGGVLVGIVHSHCNSSGILGDSRHVKEG